MAYNKRFTNRVTRSVLEIRSPHFYARPSQARAVRKRSRFVFPSTDRVTRLVNRYDGPGTHKVAGIIKHLLDKTSPNIIFIWSDNVILGLGFASPNITLPDQINMILVSVLSNKCITSLSRSVTVAEWLRAHTSQDRTVLTACSSDSVGSNPAGSPFCSELSFDVGSIPDSFNIFFPYTLFFPS